MHAAAHTHEPPWSALAAALPASTDVDQQALVRRVGRQLACFRSARLAAVPRDVRPYAPTGAPSSPLDAAADAARRAALAERPVHDPDLLRCDPRWLHADLLCWLGGLSSSAHGSPADLAPDGRTSSDPRLADLVGQPHPGLFVLPLVTAEFCERVQAELQRFAAWCAARGLAVRPPNSMNQAGAVLEDAGLGALAAWLRVRVVAPLAAHLLPGFGGASLDGQHGFSVAYGPGADRDLDLHVDDADVTLNLCLARDGAGGEVVFEGRRCLRHQQDPTWPGEVWGWSPAPGAALLHAGRHRHHVAPVIAGSRTNLIVWCRSTRLRRLVAAAAGECPAWCRAARGG